MIDRVRRFVPWVALLATLAASAASVYLESRSGSNASSPLEIAAGLAASLSSAGVGFVLATRMPRNPIGWILLADGLFFIATGLGTAYAHYGILADPGSLPGADWAVVFEDRTWPALFAGVTAIAYLFPTGSLPKGRWRTIAMITAVSFVVLIAITPFTSEAFGKPFAGVDNPLPALPKPIYSTLVTVGLFGALAGMAGAALSVRSRMRSASGPERLQLRWLAYSASIIPAAIVVCLAELAVTGSDGPATFVAVTTAITAIPVAIGVAVSRYRLYDLDRLVNRTLVYASLTALLAIAFALVSLTVGVWVGSGSTIPTAVATLAVALTFGPLRARVQKFVDRRFNRARYRGLRRVEAFLEDLRAGRAAPEETGAMLTEALADPTLELFFWIADEGGYFDAGGHALARPVPGARSELPVTRGELRLATVLHDPLLRERPDLLESVIEAAGLAIEIARLRVEVGRRLAEVEDSRARLVTAGNEERRRLERDLHDGAQQRLVSIGLSLRHLQAELPESDGDARGSLDDTVNELGQAIEELRELARGVRPPSLDDGLGAALRQLASRSPIPAEVRSTNDRFSEDIEVAAYFVASEAVTNCVKHAAASSILVEAARSNGSLIVAVTDDGRGGAQASPSSGLAGLVDRLAAVGGTLEIRSPRGGGTKVTAELPCG